MNQKTFFLELLTANNGRWRAIARAYAGQDEEDLFQEILLQIWRSLRKFEARSAVSTWCYRVALNVALGWRRAERARRQRLPIRPGYDPAKVPSRAGPDTPSEVLQRLSAELSPTDRAVFLLFLDEIGYAEMAAILGVSEGSLRVRLHRIRKRLAEIFQGEFHEL
jgi:RNA polymerase sigma-70 factor (ECF subfamily)